MTFKQIHPFMSRVSDQKHIRHLSWMKRFQGRVADNIVTPMGDDCPAQIADAYRAHSAAVSHEDQVYLIIQESQLTALIEEWDQRRDNTYVGIRTLTDALLRIGTDQQKQAAERVTGCLGHYKVSISERYQDESEKLTQLIQELEAQPLAADVATLGLTAHVATLKTENETTQRYLAMRQEERAQQDPQAMNKARAATDEAYTLLVTLINAYAVTQSEGGVSPYDQCIDYVNSDQDYYVQHVFTKDKRLRTLQVADGVAFTYVTGETWRQAIEARPDENQGWNLSPDLEVCFGIQRLLTADGQSLPADAKVAPGEYRLEEKEGAAE